MESNTGVGPGSITDQGIAPKPLLEGATEYEVVTMFNPLPEDFYGLVGQNKPTVMPFQIRKDAYTNPISTTEDDVRRNYGLNLKNPDHQAKMPIQNRVLIRAGQTLKLFGNEAQVVVRQLVNEIMQREKKSLLMADPYQRNIVEKLIIRDRQSTQEAIGGVDTVTEQMRAGVDKLNEQNNEQEFPGLGATNERFTPASPDSTDEAVHLDGRSKAARARKAAAQI